MHFKLYIYILNKYRKRHDSLQIVGSYLGVRGLTTLFRLNREVNIRTIGRKHHLSNQGAKMTHTGILIGKSAFVSAYDAAPAAANFALFSASMSKFTNPFSIVFSPLSYSSLGNLSGVLSDLKNQYHKRRNGTTTVNCCSITMLKPKPTGLSIISFMKGLSIFGVLT